jgi:hypothetical protein
MNSWVWASTPGVRRKQHAGPQAEFGMQHVEAIELVEAVDDDAPDVVDDGGAQLVERLVVAVQDHVPRRHSGAARYEEFSDRGDIELHTFFVRELGHCKTEKRFGGIRRAVGKRADCLSTPSAQLRLVVDEQRRAVVAGQRQQVAATDRELASSSTVAVSGNRCRGSGPAIRVTSSRVQRHRSRRVLRADRCGPLR